MTISPEATEHWQDALLAGAAALDIAIPEAEITLFQRHFELLMRHNERAGLTTISDPAEIAIKHFLDSLTGLLAREIRSGERVSDIGSGGGFPGVVLAAVKPGAEFVLIESSRRRAAFLRTVLQELGLLNAAVIVARAEEAGQRSEHREAYDLVVSRAVAPLPVLIEYCLPLARVGGQMLAYKGPEGVGEMAQSARALEILGGRFADEKQLSLPLGMGERTLLLIDKVAPTPARYPRRPGMPAKRPL